MHHMFTKQPNDGSSSTPASSHRWTCAAAILLACTELMLGGAAQAATVSVIHSFNYLDGRGSVFSRLIEGADGNLYGVSTEGGAFDCGTVFVIGPEGGHAVLHHFAGNNMGCFPEGGIVQGADGAIYGTTRMTSSTATLDSFGTIFRVGLQGGHEVLHRFDVIADGGGPLAGLMMASDGNMYGTASAGGSLGTDSAGTFYRLSPDGAVTVLHRFVRSNESPSTEFPIYPLTEGPDGALYGVSTQGGGRCSNDRIGSCGTVFRVTKEGAFTLLHEFSPGESSRPSGPLAVGADGHFYGTTFDGGAGGGRGSGVIYRVSAAGDYQTLAEVGDSPDTDVLTSPSGALTIGNDGNFYGIATNAFIMTPDGLLTPLFDQQAEFQRPGGGWNSPPGPIAIGAGFTLASNGALYGMSYNGGAISDDRCAPPNVVAQCGSVFRVDLDASPPVGGGGGNGGTNPGGGNSGGPAPGGGNPGTGGTGSNSGGGPWSGPPAGGGAVSSLLLLSMTLLGLLRIALRTAQAKGRASRRRGASAQSETAGHA